MSFDLFVFDAAVAPRNRVAFMAWYQEVSQRNEARDHTSPDGMTGNLRAFYDALRTKFPPMNGPEAVLPAPVASKSPNILQRFFAKQLKIAPAAPVNEAMLTDYTFATSAIYMAFAGSVSGEAYNAVINTALSHDVGFFDVSAEGGDILYTASDIEDLMGL